MAFVLVVALSALVYQEGVHGKTINSIVGPYISYGERFYMCEPNDRPLPCRWHLRATHFNPSKPKELQRLTGNVTLMTAIDDSSWLKINVDARSNNQWKENAYILYFKNNACRSIRENFPGFYDNFFKKTEVTGTCIVKPGVYEVNNTPVGWNFPNVPVLFYGQYRFKIMLGKAENLYACWVSDARTIPKPQ